MSCNHWAAQRLHERRGRFTSRHYQSGLLFDRLTVESAYKQTPESLRRNGLPVKLIDRALLMRHEHLAGSPVELLEGTETAPRSNDVLHHPPEAFDGVEVVPTMGR